MDSEADYDVLDAEFVRDPYPQLAELRTRCPVPHSERWGGSWMPVCSEDIRAVATDFEHFSSADIFVVPFAEVEKELNPLPDGMFIMTDPPEHGPLRRLVLPFFAPQAVTAWEPSTRAFCRRLVTALAA
jgi:cytochrome P450